MNSGRHFSPPTPAFRPQDPFSTAAPRLAEAVPSCEAVTPPPFRPRPVRMDPLESKDSKGQIKRSIPKPYVETTQVLVETQAKISADRIDIIKSRKQSRFSKQPLAKPIAPEIKSKPKATIIKESKPLLKHPLKKQLIKTPIKKIQSSVSNQEEIKKCEWVRCDKTFIVKPRGNAVVRRFCSATCRGRASEVRTGKRPSTKKTK